MQSFLRFLAVFIIARFERSKMFSRLANWFLPPCFFKPYIVVSASQLEVVATNTCRDVDVDCILIRFCVILHMSGARKSKKKKLLRCSLSTFESNAPPPNKLIDRV